jgi:hypothetical protein
MNRPIQIQCEYLFEVPIDSKFYRTNGRWDHMYMIPRNEQNPAFTREKRLQL